MGGRDRSNNPDFLWILLNRIVQPAPRSMRRSRNVAYRSCRVDLFLASFLHSHDLANTAGRPSQAVHKGPSTRWSRIRQNSDVGSVASGSGSRRIRRLRNADGLRRPSCISAIPATRQPPPRHDPPTGSGDQCCSGWLLRDPDSARGKLWP